MLVGAVLCGYRESMGYWHDPITLAKAARDAHLSVQFYGSLHYLYRFHAVMQPEAE